MSEWDAPEFNQRPAWSQGMLVLPDLVCIDFRVWISSNRGRWSTATQVAAGLDHDLVQLAVSEELPWRSPRDVGEVARSSLVRLTERYVEPFPPKNVA